MGPIKGPGASSVNASQLATLLEVDVRQVVRHMLEPVTIGGAVSLGYFVTLKQR